MLKPESPCLGCDYRSEDCHKDCDSYEEYVEANERYKDIINQSKREEDIGYTLVEQQIKNKNKKYKRPCHW